MKFHQGEFKALDNPYLISFVFNENMKYDFKINKLGEHSQYLSEFLCNVHYILSNLKQHF